MGMKVAPAELKRWQSAGLIPIACCPKRGKAVVGHHQHQGDGRPAWRVSLTLPDLRLVSRANAREHWGKRHARDKRESHSLRAAWHAAGLNGWATPLPVAVTLTRLGGKPMDGDNLQGALKALRDAVATLIAVDDADDRVKWRYRQKPGHKTASVTITIWPRR